MKLETKSERTESKNSELSHNESRRIDGLFSAGSKESLVKVMELSVNGAVRWSPTLLASALEGDVPPPRGEEINRVEDTIMAYAPQNRPTMSVLRHCATLSC